MDEFRQKLINDIKLARSKQEIKFCKIMLPLFFLIFLISISNLYFCDYKTMEEYYDSLIISSMVGILNIMFNHILLFAIKTREETIANMVLNEL